MHTIENEELRVMISNHGAELSGIFDKRNNREVLWNADPKYWKRHAPVLDMYPESWTHIYMN